MATTSTASAVRAESLNGRLPIPKDERPYKSYYIGISVFFSFGVATWGFLTGGFLGTLANFPLGISAFFAGQLIGIAVGAFGVGLICNRFGIEMIDAIKGTYGPRGSWIVLAASLINFLGWIYILMVLAGQSVGNIVDEMFGISNPRLVVGVACAAALLTSIAVASRGPGALASLAGWVAPSLVVMSLVMLVLLLNRFGAGLLTMEPTTPVEDLQTNYVLIIEYGLAFGLSYWVTMGAVCRLFPRARVATVSVLTGWGVLSTVVIGVAMLSGLALGSGDPTDWMIPLAGKVGGIIALLFVAIANVSSMVGMLYILGVQAQQFRWARNMNFGLLLAIFALPGGILFMVSPSLLMDNYGVFLGYNAVVFAPVAAVVLVDFLVLRRQRLEVRDLFIENASSRYWFWGGVNPAAIASVAAGCVLYVWIFNPVTGVSGDVFRYATATLPTLAVSGMLYFLLMRYLVIPAGRGHYESPSAELPRARQEATTATVGRITDTETPQVSQ